MRQRMDSVTRSYLPLINVWAPQLFGQQFYASNFTWGTFTASDALDRLHAHEWFWSAPIGERHCSFLRENDIKYLLIRRDMPFPHKILDVSDYYLLRVIPAPAVYCSRGAVDGRGTVSAIPARRKRRGRWRASATSIAPIVKSTVSRHSRARSNSPWLPMIIPLTLPT